MAYTFTVSDVIPATPEAIYNAWLDSRGHSAMTGGKATASAEVGGAFTAWDGYISGRNVQLVPNTRIVQTWRSTNFAPTAQYSVLTVLLEPVPGGTRVTLVHAGVPDDHKGYQDGGWQTHYFDPMKKYFGKPAAPKAAKGKPAKAKPAKAKAAKPKVAKAKKKAAKAKPAKAKAAKAKPAKAKASKAKAAKAKRSKAKTAKRKTASRKVAKRKAAKRKVATRKVARRKTAKRRPAKARQRR